MPGRAFAFAALCLLAAVITFGFPRPLSAQQSGDPARVKALIVAVADYKLLGSEKMLPRSIADASELGRALVDVLKVPKGNVKVLADNPTRDQIRKAWEKHVAELTPKDVSIFFFSGHGAQHNRQQYLLPADFNPKYAADHSGVALVELLNKLRSSGRKNFGIFIVDACRTNPSGSPPARSSATDESDDNVEANLTESSDTFAPVRAPEGTFIFYAASANQMALHDLGKGDDSAFSVYTRVLLPLIKNQARGLHDIAKDVRWETYQLALARKTAAGVRKPYIQIPAYFDDALQRVNFLGKGLPVTRVQAEKGAEVGVLGGDKNVWACPSCPEMIQIPSTSEPITVRGGIGPTPAAPGVNLDKPYFIGKYEVTREEWRACQGAKSCRVIDPDIIEGDRRPITGVTWEDTKGFIAWLNSQPGLKGFRLPREAEWEHAARGGSSSEYGPANEVRELCDYANGADASLKTFMWANLLCNDGKGRGTTTAGSYRPNLYGAHDMQGNVWEWVDACYDTACTLRIAKGGSWRSGPDTLKIGAFQAYAADRGRATVGFRVARDAD